MISLRYLIKDDDVLIARGEDLRNIGIFDEIRFHMSFLKPPHRFEGTLKLSEKALIFEGKDKGTANSMKRNIFSSAIRSICLWLFGEKQLSFEGEYKETKNDYKMRIRRNQLATISMGRDELFKEKQTRGFVVVPLRLKYIKNGKKKFLYIITNYHRLGGRVNTRNKRWYVKLKKWMRRR